MQLQRVEDELPAALAELATAAAAEGVRNVARLIDAWSDGTQRFNTHGAALFVAYLDGELAGIGGVKRETAVGELAMRMHRFYVHPAFRRRGVATALASAALQHALRSSPLITCNAQASPAAAPFWEAMGFAPVTAPGYTHVFRTGTITPA